MSTAAEQRAARRGTRKRPSVAIVGGGIAGLYAAYLLGLRDVPVRVFEASGRWGGRIDSQRYRVDGAHDLIAEFGPMRFESDLQDRLRRLCFHLGIELERFPQTSGAPSTMNYDLTELEQSFDSTAHLLCWAVLRMFFEDDVTADLKRVERDESWGMEELRVLRRHMDARLFCKPGGGGSWIARSDEDIEQRFADLRHEAQLLGRSDGPYLAGLGLWNALSEVISPGAIAKIRDAGTFYHLISLNPSALDWGIFWLRQASVMGSLFQFTRATAEHGTASLVTALVERIDADCRSVSLMLNHEVESVEHGKRADEVVLRVTCHDGGEGARYSFDQRADHVVLALPRQPLLRLSEHFPRDVRERLQSVAPMPLLKAFVVTRRPWWPCHHPPQSFAWLVPTRELHYFRAAESDCPRRTDPGSACTCATSHAEGGLLDTGMVMLYTDQPATAYWQGLIPPETRGETLWHERSANWADEVERDQHGLLANLVRRLLMISDPGLARRINASSDEIRRHLRSNPALESKVDDAPSTTLRFAEQILHATKEQADEDAMTAILAAAEVTSIPGWRESLEQALKYAEFGQEVERWTKCSAADVLAWGIRDWSAPPFGGAAHVWLPEADEARRRGSAQPFASDDLLIAFGLRGREAQHAIKNVHVCGEAYSGFQGFIEGALRTAEQVVETLIPQAAPANAEIARSPHATALEQQWIAARDQRIHERWDSYPAS